ncbi:MAG: MltA domain-containing protein [Rhodospirillales bacterium]
MGRARLSAAVLAAALAACAAEPEQKPSVFGSLSLAPVAFRNLPGWQLDDHRAALITFVTTCRRFDRLKAVQPLPPASYAGLASDWQSVCAVARGAVQSGTSAKQFFEDWFQPFAAADKNQTTGLITGYFEPQLNGSKKRSARYNVPLYGRPRDLISVDLGQFDTRLAGRRIAGQVRGNNFIPYADRSEIERGVLTGKGLEMVWVDNAIDAFFLHIQGSGRILLDSGETMRVGFDGKNGRPYRAIGRDLVAMGAIPQKDISLQSIRKWLTDNPGRARALMNRNPSYVFFKRIVGPGPIGAAGMPLTPGRSFAVDLKYIPMGAPIWLATTNPLNPLLPLARLVVAQDTGSAITGPVRGDLFWGYGRYAREAAGRMKNPGRLYLLLPKSAARRTLLHSG